MSNRTKLSICSAVFVIAIINFVVFSVVAAYLGGDAVNGKVEGDHFFLMSHGRYTEVDKNVFIYSKWHAYSVWATHPLALAAGSWYWWLKKKQDA